MPVNDFFGSVEGCRESGRIHFGVLQRYLSALNRRDEESNDPEPDIVERRLLLYRDVADRFVQEGPPCVYPQTYVDSLSDEDLEEEISVLRSMASEVLSKAEDETASGDQMFETLLQFLLSLRLPCFQEETEES